MFARLSAAVLVALPLLVAATPTSQCSSGNQQCCNSVQSAGSTNVATLLASVGAPVQGANVPIGVDCTPLSVLAVAGNSCNTQTVCCENNSFNGVVAIGCTPINVNL